jgi:hypothetical protein
VHPYSPVYLGKARPWIVFGEDRRLADLLVRELKTDLASLLGSTNHIRRRTRFIIRSSGMPAPSALPGHDRDLQR